MPCSTRDSVGGKAKVLFLVKPVRYHNMSPKRRKALRAQLQVEVDAQSATFTATNTNSNPGVEAANYECMIVHYVVVTSYTMAAADREELSKLCQLLGRRPTPSVDVPASEAQGQQISASTSGDGTLRRLSYCILDEAHKISQPKSKSTRACKILGAIVGGVCSELVLLLLLLLSCEFFAQNTISTGGSVPLSQSFCALWL